LVISIFGILEIGFVLHILCSKWLKFPFCADKLRTPDARLQTTVDKRKKRNSEKELIGYWKPLIGYSPFQNASISPSSPSATPRRAKNWRELYQILGGSQGKIEFLGGFWV
jgi:hypothetical protein